MLNCLLTFITRFSKIQVYQDIKKRGKMNISTITFHHIQGWSVIVNGRSVTISPTLAGELVSQATTDGKIEATCGNPEKLVTRYLFANDYGQRVEIPPRKTRKHGRSRGGVISHQPQRHNPLTGRFVGGNR